MFIFITKIQNCKRKNYRFKQILFDQKVKNKYNNFGEINLI